jgi:3-deoxy-D-manno-octulosonate 8-phosphate phosphatase KdsC-like HAD superfamily phosphatase
LSGAVAIKSIFERHGATAKISDIHVNGWFGDYDKLGMMRLFARQVWDIDLDVERDRFIFVGDSPNDEPMFDFFPHACAVANVNTFTDMMHNLPAWVAAKEGGDGFAEIVDVIVSRRTVG